MWPARWWTVAVAAIVVLGGGNWTMPVARLAAELIAIGLLMAAIGSRRSSFPVRLAVEDWLVLAAAALLVAFVVPLPPAVWSTLPGRDFAVRIDLTAFGAPQWRPLSLDPTATLRVMVGMLPAIAVYLSTRTGDTRRVAGLLAGILLGSGLSAIAAFAQSAMPDADWLHFYPRGDYEFPVGLFTNHNHQALFLLCAIPLVALRDWDAGWSPVRHGPAGWRLALTAIIAIPLALATGSRTVAALMPASLLAIAVALYGAGKRAVTGRKARSWTLMAGLVTVPVVLLALLWLLGGEGIATPLRRGALAGDQRWAFWPLVLHAARIYWPIGSGPGTFVEVFQMHEPLGFVSTSILNHAHDEYLQIAFECGLAGLLLTAAVLARLLQASWRAWALPGLTSGPFTARMTSLPLLLAAIHSLVDYPARTFATGSVLAFCWARQARLLPIPRAAPAARSAACRPARC